jgi:hypothetical protein
MILMPELSLSAARAIDEIFRTSSAITSHIPEVTLEVRRLYTKPVDIVDRIFVLQGYTCLLARSLTADETVTNLGVIIAAIFTVDFDTCDAVTALVVLKAVFAIGKELYSTAPGKLEAKTWIEGDGRILSEKVRMAVSAFAPRFDKDFEVMEVSSLYTYLKQIITEIMSFSLTSGRGLLVFSPVEVTYMVSSHFGQGFAMNANSSPLVLNLATSLVKVYSGKTKTDISPQIDLLIDQITKSLLPPNMLPAMVLEMASFPPELLQDVHRTPFRKMTGCYPELYFKYFEFLARTTYRYSLTWKKDVTQNWMVCILVSLGHTEAGMAFQGAADFLVYLCIVLLTEGCPRR